MNFFLAVLLGSGWNIVASAKICTYKKGTINYSIQLLGSTAEINYGPDKGGTGDGGLLNYDFTMTDGTVRYSNSSFYVFSAERNDQTLVRLVDRKTWENLIEYEPCVEEKKEDINVICKAILQNYEILVTEQRVSVPQTDVKKRMNFLTYNRLDAGSRKYIQHLKIEMFPNAWAGGPPAGPNVELPYLTSSSGLDLYKRVLGNDTLITLKSAKTSTTYFENLKCSNQKK